MSLERIIIEALKEFANYPNPLIKPAEAATIKIQWESDQP